MPLSQYLKASGTKVHAGDTGQCYSNTGKLFVSAGSLHGIDANLWAILKIAVDALGVAINITSTDGGVHVAGSRHYKGNAVDIGRVGKVDRVMLRATLKNAWAVKLVEYLIGHGMTGGHEHHGISAVLFGPCGSENNKTDIDHSDHLHVSVWE